MRRFRLICLLFSFGAVVSQAQAQAHAQAASHSAAAPAGVGSSATAAASALRAGMTRTHSLGQAPGEERVVQPKPLHWEVTRFEHSLELFIFPVVDARNNSLRRK
jgi:hypothetical protein